jgi:hypothetical protein
MGPHHADGRHPAGLKRTRGSLVSPLALRLEAPDLRTTLAARGDPVASATAVRRRDLQGRARVRARAPTTERAIRGRRSRRSFPALPSQSAVRQTFRSASAWVLFVERAGEDRADHERAGAQVDGEEEGEDRTRRTVNLGEVGRPGEVPAETDLHCLVPEGRGGTTEKGSAPAGTWWGR